VPRAGPCPQGALHMLVAAAACDLVVVVIGHDSHLHEVVHLDVGIQKETTHDYASEIRRYHAAKQIQGVGGP
jgi:hypothetical protein